MTGRIRHTLSGNDLPPGLSRSRLVPMVILAAGVVVIFALVSAIGGIS